MSRFPTKPAFDWKNKAISPKMPADPILAEVSNGKVLWWGAPATQTLSLWGPKDGPEASLPARKSFRVAIADGVYWATPAQLNGVEWEDAGQFSGWRRPEIAGFSWEPAEAGDVDRAILSGGATRATARATAAELDHATASMIGAARELLAIHLPWTVADFDVALATGQGVFLDGRYTDGRCDYSHISHYAHRGLSGEEALKYAQVVVNVVSLAGEALRVSRNKMDVSAIAWACLREKLEVGRKIYRKIGDSIPSPEIVAAYRAAWDAEQAAGKGRGGLGGDSFGYSE